MKTKSQPDIEREFAGCIINGVEPLPLRPSFKEVGVLKFGEKAEVLRIGRWSIEQQEGQYTSSYLVKHDDLGSLYHTRGPFECVDYINRNRTARNA